MTNYLRLLVAATVLCAACSAGENPAAPAAPAAGPATSPAAKPAAPPPAGAAAANAPAAAPGATRYKSAGGTLTFTFTQADAANTGGFPKFSTELSWDEKSSSPTRLDVSVQVAALETQDKDRDDTLKSEDLLNVAKFPTAQYSATSFTKSGAGFVAQGKLTLRGVTRDLRLPLRIQSTANGLALSGEVTLKRLDFGVGQGDWKSTEWVGDEVKLQFKVPLSRTG
jgi:polyisoprenoid-binding protein YceI